MADFFIAPASAGDADRLCEIECACFVTPWSKASLLSFISNAGHALCLTARTGPKESSLILGYIGLIYVLDEGEISNIAVHPDSRGQGIGYSLLCAAQEYCRQAGVHTLHLEVRPGNIKALSLYGKCGFVQSGLRRGYYEDNGDDALLYTWKAM